MGTTLGNSATTLGDPDTTMGTTLGKNLDIAAVELDGRAFRYRELPDTTEKI